MNPLTEPLNVAVVCITDPTSGGATSYEAGIVRHLEQIKDPHIQFTYYLPKNSSLVDSGVLPNQRVRKYRSGLREMFALSLRLSLPGFAILRRVGLTYGRLERDFRRQRISLAYFLAPNPLALDLVDTPMINTVWDLGHRDLPEFVEITGTRHYEERELFFRSVLPKSFRVVVETAWTAQRIACLYDVDRERIIKIDLGSVDKIIPSSPSPAKVPPYFFYPAQFWPHKRHIMLLNAFAEVIRVHPEVKLVLTGADKGNLEHVKRKVSELGLSNYVSFLGFVSDDQVEELYKHALAVVFPSSLGPSNLPPIEAMRHGVPSLVSNAHHDPQLESPLVTIVEGQDPSLWARAMIGVLEGDHKRQVNPTGDHERGQPMSVLHETLESFREIRSEWR